MGYPIYLRGAGAYYKIIDHKKVVEAQESKSINEQQICTYEVEEIVSDLTSNLCNIRITEEEFLREYVRVLVGINNLVCDDDQLEESHE